MFTDNQSMPAKMVENIAIWRFLFFKSETNRGETKTPSSWRIVRKTELGSTLIERL